MINIFRDDKHLVSDSSEEELNILTTKSVDGREYFLVIDDWYVSVTKGIEKDLKVCLLPVL